MKKQHTLLLAIILVGLFLLFISQKSHPKANLELIAPVKKRSFAIDVKAIGELEATYSTTIASQLRGDNGKLIYLIPDGTNVKIGDLLVKIDPTPFEEKLESLQNKLRDQNAHIATLEKLLAWEISQAERDDKMAFFDVEAAELELNKIIHGDGPLEIAKLKTSMSKALAKYDELSGYSQDLLELQQQGFLNPSEIKNAQKRLDEEKETYEAAKLQYESYVAHVHPMHLKKAEAALRQAKIRQEEAIKVRGHSIGKAKIELEQAKQSLEGIKLQIRDAQRELALTEIYAPTQGMVVQREDFRNGQRRKPRIGDLAVRNQILLELPDLTSMTVKSKVREIDLCRVCTGKIASVEIDAFPNLIFSGTLNSIGVLALTDPTKPSDEKYFDIRILLKDIDSRIRPGMTSRLTIHAEKVENALTVPVHALFYDQKTAFCYVATGNSYEKRAVIPGAHNEEWSEIKEGLTNGEWVCLTMPADIL
ncbi:MAG: efflux RND transporter periplasmic adaptor subunit [Parachlamydiaceae bacterium]|nr:efflux RND transporter periplasmic adaptor subunit [Parachlamydiaceae bacterium]